MYQYDPRTSDWFLMSRPMTMITIFGFYLYFCISLDPRYMKDKQPYRLRKTLIVYTFIQVILSTYILYIGLIAGWLFDYSYTCQPIDYSESPSATRPTSVAFGKIMESLCEWFYEDVYKKNDPRTSDWFLMSRPLSLIAILGFYLYFCVSLGPRFMRYRSPYRLRNTLIAYNFVQVILSTYIVYIGLMAGWLFDYSYTCQPIDYSESPSAMRIARGAHFYFICKIIELLDTVFFVLRKKQCQVSFLHLYHHTAMPIFTWIGVRYFAGGHGTLFGLINSFVHIFMYGYYMLAALGPHVQKYLWWKKYLTMLQIVQFCIVGAHSAQVLFNNCDYPKAFAAFIVFDCVVFFYMFGSFYVKTYIKSNARNAEVKGASTNFNKSAKSD